MAAPPADSPRAPRPRWPKAPPPPPPRACRRPRLPSSSGPTRGSTHPHAPEIRAADRPVGQGQGQESLTKPSSSISPRPGARRRSPRRASAGPAHGPALALLTAEWRSSIARPWRGPSPNPGRRRWAERPPRQARFPTVRRAVFPRNARPLAARSSPVHEPGDAPHRGRRPLGRPTPNSRPGLGRRRWRLPVAKRPRGVDPGWAASHPGAPRPRHGGAGAPERR